MYDVKLKYVILDDMLPIIFTDGVSHDTIPHGTGMRATSAGFVHLVPITTMKGNRINATVYGESISLGLESRGDHDNAIIEKFLNQYDE